LTHAPRRTHAPYGLEESDLDDRWGDYTFYRMSKVIDVYFVGGFGKLQTLKPKPSSG
jgi:hypothetical protein